jgi:hypothetical protein
MTTPNENMPNEKTVEPAKLNPDQHRRMEEMPQALIGSELLEEENEISSESHRVNQRVEGDKNDQHAPMETLMPITPGKGEGDSPATRIVRGDN